MTPSKSIAAIVAACLALAAVGCSNQRGKGGRTAQFSFGSDASKAPKAGKQQPAQKNTRNQPVSYEADSSLSPEASVKRDLEKLRQKEKEQIKTLKEMRDAMAQGSEIIRKEEDRLTELRRQIEQFEAAQHLYQQAAVDRGVRNEAAAARPAGFDSGEYEQSYRTASAAYSGDVRAPDPAEVRNNAAPARRDYPDPRQLSDGGGHGRPQPGPEPRSRPQATYARPGEDEAIWNPPERLFSPFPTQPASRPAQPASFPPPAEPRKQAQPVPARPSGINMGANNVDDDIFTPDMFLSGGK